MSNLRNYLKVTVFIFFGSLTTLAFSQQSSSNQPFTMIIASDTQFFWECKYCPQGTPESEGKNSNSWQVGAMNDITDAESNHGKNEKRIWPTTVPELTKGAGSPILDPVGVIINGDLTAFARTPQIESYFYYYGSMINFDVFPGLGNHDYGKDNNGGGQLPVEACVDFPYNLFKDGSNHCAMQMVRYIRSLVVEQNVPNFNPFLLQGFNEGSLAYSFDIKDYHFVQLQLYPHYVQPVIGISSSMDWLEQDLNVASALGKKIVLNMHSIYQGSKFTEFVDLIDDYNVVALFTGHQHQKYWPQGTIKDTNIPHFKSGSSEYNKFLLVEFGDTYINVATMDAKNGTPSFYYGTDSCDMGEQRDYVKTFLHPQPTPSPPIPSGSYWSIASRLKGVTSNGPPALAEHINKLVLAWNGHDNDGIYYAYFDGISWSASSKIPQSDTYRSDNPPALAVFNGKLYAAWMQPGSDQYIRLSSTTNGVDWIPEPFLGGIGTQQGPALAAYNKKLYCTWNGYHNDGIFYASFDGNSWSEKSKILEVATKDSPALAEYDNKLYIAWNGYNEDGIFYASFDGNSWSGKSKILEVATKDSPALAEYNNKLYIAWNGYNEDGIFYASFDGSLSNKSKANISGLDNSESPSLGSFNGRLYLGWANDGIRTANYVVW